MTRTELASVDPEDDYATRFAEIERASRNDRTAVEQLLVERIAIAIAPWRAALEQALYGPYDEQDRIGRCCARCNRHLDDGEGHSETCPYPLLAAILE